MSDQNEFVTQQDRQQREQHLNHPQHSTIETVQLEQQNAQLLSGRVLMYLIGAVVAVGIIVAVFSVIS